MNTPRSVGIANLQTFLDQELFRRPCVRVLEAGCGSASNLKIQRQVRLVGIDISEKQLARNTVLHEKIVGDIQRYEFPPASFDAIICWDVLEHLSQPELRCASLPEPSSPAASPSSGCPMFLSLKGLVTKCLPHTFHVLAYRYIWGINNAGESDTLPFKTYLRLCIQPGQSENEAHNLDCTPFILLLKTVGDFHGLQRKKAMHFFYVTLKKILGLLSLGHIGNSELIIVLKNGNPA